MRTEREFTKKEIKKLFKNGFEPASKLTEDEKKELKELRNNYKVEREQEKRMKALLREYKELKEKMDSRDIVNQNNRAAAISKWIKS